MHLILDSLSIALKQKNMIDVCHEIHTLKNRLGKKNQVHYPLLQKHLQQL